MEARCFKPWELFNHKYSQIFQARTSSALRTPRGSVFHFQRSQDIFVFYFLFFTFSIKDREGSEVRYERDGGSSDLIFSHTKRTHIHLLPLASVTLATVGTRHPSCFCSEVVFQVSAPPVYLYLCPPHVRTAGKIHLPPHTQHISVEKDGASGVERQFCLVSDERRQNSVMWWNHPSMPSIQVDNRQAAESPMKPFLSRHANKPRQQKKSIRRDDISGLWVRAEDRRDGNTLKHLNRSVKLL